MFKRINAQDKKISLWLYHHQTSAAVYKTMVFFSLIGKFGAIWLLLALALLFFDPNKKHGLILIVAVFCSWFIGSVIIKSIVKRSRPCQDYFPHPLATKTPKDSSFPSGHTSSSFAAVTIFAFIQPSFLFLVLPLALLISFSRLYLFVHYLSDLLFGMVLGITISLCCLYFSTYFNDFFSML